MLERSDQVLIVLIIITHIPCGHAPVLIQIHIIIVLLIRLSLLEAGLSCCGHRATLQLGLVVLLDRQACACTSPLCISQAPNQHEEALRRGLILTHCQSLRIREHCAHSQLGTQCAEGFSTEHGAI